MAALFRTNNITTKFVRNAQIFNVCTTPLKITAKKSDFISEIRGTCAINLVTEPENISSKGPLLCSAASKNVNVVVRRLLHSDVRFPNFDDNRRPETLDACTPARDTEDARRAMAPAIYYGVGGMLSLIAAKEAVQKIIGFKWIPADQQALAAVEVDLNEIPEGQIKTYEWRGKPVFVAHRTAETIALERSVPLNELRDPEKDEDRVQKDEWLVVVGVCTHLGCVPIPNEGEYKGYFCPCHGSHYDASGRIRKGPAPTNMIVPDYVFNGNTLIVGEK